MVLWRSAQVNQPWFSAVLIRRSRDLCGGEYICSDAQLFQAALPCIAVHCAGRPTLSIKDINRQPCPIAL